MAALVFCVPEAAVAAIENTHHDMGYMTGSHEKGVCSFCHLPHNAYSEKGLYARSGDGADLIGNQGAFCYSCHDGTVIPGAIIEAPDGSVGLDVLLRSHGYNLKRMSEATGGLEGSSNLQNSGLVSSYAEVETADWKMNCLTCHDVHSNRFPPFLAVPLESLCQKCHSGSNMAGKGRWNSITDTGEANQAHPVMMAVADSGKDRVRGEAPEQSFHWPYRFFSVPAPPEEIMALKDKHWETGGHLVGKSGEVGCPTCHSAHMPGKNLLVAAATENFDKMVCGGCHGRVGDPWNPGATEATHPVFEFSAPPYKHDHESHGKVETRPDLPSQGSIEVFVSMPSSFPLTRYGELTCLSCHKIHGGKPGAKCLRASQPKWSGGVQCIECHSPGSYVDGMNWHHPVGSADYTVQGFPQLTSWAWGVGLPGDLSDGLQCTDCHVGWAKSAHNWDK